jgi:hypothetical protein
MVSTTTMATAQQSMPNWMIQTLADGARPLSRGYAVCLPTLSLFPSILIFPTRRASGNARDAYG